MAYLLQGDNKKVRLTMGRVFSIIFILIIANSLLGQSSSDMDALQKLEVQLIDKLKEVRTFTERADQIKPNKEFEELLRKALSYDGAFVYPFKDLGMMMGTIKSPDETFRLFNWNLEYGEQEEQKYHCLIMKKDPRKGSFIIIELFDKSENASYQVEYEAKTEKTWYGALYYKIIPVERMGGTVYTLLGWDGNNMMSNKKIIETMQFHRTDKVKFGQAIFRSEDDKNKRRVIFQYNKQSVMSLKHQETKKTNMIIFDHLSPTSPNLEGMKDWYVPDLSFDAYVLENGRWNYVPDVDARTGKKFKTKYNAPDNEDKPGTRP